MPAEGCTGSGGTWRSNIACHVVLKNSIEIIRSVRLWRKSGDEPEQGQHSMDDIVDDSFDWY